MRLRLRILQSSSDSIPGCDKAVERPGGIGRACGRKAEGRPAGTVQTVFVVEPAGGSAVCKNLAHRGGAKDAVQVIWNCIPDGTVAGPRYLAAFYDVPQSDMVSQQKFLFFQQCLTEAAGRLRLPVHARNDSGDGRKKTGFPWI